MASDIQAEPSPALFLEEILEQIFPYLDNQSLLASRLVCRLWRFSATFQLRKKMQIHLYDFHLGVPDLNKKNQQDKSLDNLPTILRQSEALNFLFPCNNFSFTKTDSGDPWANLSDAGFQTFLYTHGPGHIKELSLSSMGKTTPRGYHCPHESVVMQQVQNLLLHQTPNLNTLTLDIESEIEWKYKDYSTVESQDQDPLQITDEEYKEIHQKLLSIPMSSRNTSLKVFKIGSELSAKVFETVILLCPNLQEIVIENESFLPYCIYPVNRLQFIKTLDFDLSPFGFKILEKIIGVQQEEEKWNLKLRQFTLSFYNFEIGRSLLRYVRNDELENRIFSVVNKILASNADILKTFVWHGIIFSYELRLPTSFPNVTRLELSNPRIGKEIQIFPADFFKVPTTFPKLKHVSLHWNNEDGFMNLLNLFNPTGNLQVLSVKSVDITFDKHSSQKDLPTEVLQQVYNVFPNALVKIILNDDSN